jgi:hypothetical protein
MFGQDAEAGSDLDDDVGRLERGRLQDRAERELVGQEVLAEPLLRPQAEALEQRAHLARGTAPLVSSRVALTRPHATSGTALANRRPASSWTAPLRHV